MTIALLDTSEDLAVCSAQLGGMDVGQLLTPLSGFKNRGGKFAIDNGAFAGFDEHKFLLRLARETENAKRCLFVAVPDIFDVESRKGSARRTLEVFARWRARPEMRVWRAALVLQDGIENFDLPWDDMDAVFVGGSTDFKQSKAARECALAARALRKWVHVGRVNTGERLDAWEPYADSIDGTGLSKYTHMRESAARSPTPLLDHAEVVT